MSSVQAAPPPHLTAIRVHGCRAGPAKSLGLVLLLEQPHLLLGRQVLLLLKKLLLLEHLLLVLLLLVFRHRLLLSLLES